MNADEWVHIVQNTARRTYQILDFGDDADGAGCDARKRRATWKRVLHNAIVAGCALYGIPRSALDFIWV